MLKQTAKNEIFQFKRPQNVQIHQNSYFENLTEDSAFSTMHR